MKVVLSLASIPEKEMVCAPVVATENVMLNDAKLVLAGEIKLPIWIPSTLTLIGCTNGDRCAAWNESV